MRKAGKRRKSSGPSDPSERGDRARRTAAVGAYRKATTGLVSSMLSFNEQDDVRWAQALLPTSNLGPSAHCGPHQAPLLHCQNPPGTGPSLVCNMPLSLLLARLGLVLSTSLTCSTSRAGFMPTKSMQRCPHCFAGSPQARCLLPPGGSHAHGSAGNARRMASRVPSRWVSSFAQPMPSAW